MRTTYKVNVHYPTKSITVTGEFFWPMNVPFKIKATYEEWKSWHEIHLNQFCEISIQSIFDHICRPKKNDIEVLKRYAYEEPEEFLWDFYKIYLRPTLFFSPLTSRKSRRLHHSISTTEFKYIAIHAKWLYVLLEHWKKVPKHQWPNIITNFVKLHDLTIEQHTSCILTNALISLFGVELGDYENYCHDHVWDEDIKVLRKMITTINHLPQNSYLSLLFENLTAEERLKKLTS